MSVHKFARATLNETEAALAQGIATKADVDIWRRLLDPQLVDERTFLEQFEIKTDTVEDPLTGEAPDPWVPFRWREVQIAEYELFEENMKRQRPTRLRIPKSRGHGVSSWNLALLGFCRTLRIPGYETKVVAQDQDESEEHLARLNDFYEQVDWAALRELGIRKVKSTRKSIVIQFGNMKKSKVRVMTARKQGLGRGGASDAIITTERPHWPAKAKKDLTGLLSRLSRSKWSAHIDESTANGFEDFYTACMKAQDKVGSYRLLFLPAFKRPNNYLKPDRFNREELLSDLGKNEHYGGIEEIEKRDQCAAYWKEQHLLDDEAAAERALQFIAWRRLTIDDECDGSLAFFWREHPTTLEEAFQGSGRPVFNLPFLRTWADDARRRQEFSILFGLEARDKGLRAQPRQGGLWRVLEAPKEDVSYCFGCDVSKGYEVHADGVREADFSVVNVKDVFTGRTVAKLRAHLFPHELAWEIVKAAQWFNGAKGLVEVNNDGGTVVSFIANMETDWGPALECLLQTKRKVHTETGPEERKQLGWYTSGGPGGSKPYMVGVMHRFIEETGRARNDKGEARGPCPWDFDTLTEMLLFVHGDRGKMQAERGHDDCVVAEGLALVSRQMQLEDGDVKIQSPAAPAIEESDVKRALREQDARMAAAAVKGGVPDVPELPGF